MSSPPHAAPEFSRLFRIAELGNRELTLELEADADERAALAGRFGLVALTSLRVEARLRWRRGGVLLRLSGHLQAALIQNCVVTLEPFSSTIEEKFSLLYRPHAGLPEGACAVLDGEEEAEKLDSDSLDVGEAVAEELALAIDPYPRKPGADLVSGPFVAGKDGVSDRGEGAGAIANKPFEGLAALKGNK
jgi:uncharacterized metal-binding protein YceD (DUF177 family)